MYPCLTSTSLLTQFSFSPPKEIFLFIDKTLSWRNDPAPSFQNSAEQIRHFKKTFFQRKTVKVKLKLQPNYDQLTHKLQPKCYVTFDDVTRMDLPDKEGPVERV